MLYDYVIFFVGFSSSFCQMDNCFHCIYIQFSDLWYSNNTWKNYTFKVLDSRDIGWVIEFFFFERIELNVNQFYKKKHLIMAKSISYLYNQFWHPKSETKHTLNYQFSSITLVITLSQYNMFVVRIIKLEWRFSVSIFLLCYLFYTYKMFDCNLKIQIKTTVESLFFFSKLVNLREMMAIQDCFVINDRYDGHTGLLCYFSPNMTVIMMFFFF